MLHRPEIDGLRALAVLPVILFHAGVSGFGGGFVGVDVFFVISGYLIASIILGDLGKGRFSIVAFYERRARRILPALFLVMAVSIPFAWMWLLPREMNAFARSLGAVSLFVSNIQFWKESGYFDAAGEWKPMLHTWSLAVEEQFYVIFPVLMLALWRFAKNRVFAVLAVAAVGSLALAQWGALNRPGFAFFMLPTRAWELLVGALIAARPWRSEPDARIADALALAGMAAILGAVFFYDRATLFPGLPALAPTLGAGAIILFAREGGLAHRLLSLKPVVAIGLISYSLYLWHQPVLAFLRHRFIGEPQGWALAAALLLLLPLSAASWRFVEQPFRRANLVGRRAIFTFSAAGIAAFLAFAGASQATKGFAFRIPAEALRLAQAADDKNPRVDECVSGSHRYLPPAQSCVIGDGSNVVGVLFGDSHADAMAHALGQALTREKLGLRLVWYSSCPPVPGVQHPSKGLDHRCADYVREALDLLKADPKLVNVVLMARWPAYLEGTMFDNGEGGVEGRDPLTVDGVEYRGKTRSEAERRAFLAGRYADAVRALLAMGKRVVLVEPVPEMGRQTPNAMAKSQMMGLADKAVSSASDVVRARFAATLAAFAGLGDAPELRRVRPQEIFCDTFVKGRCVGADGDKVFYFDDNHLSGAGAALVAPHIVEGLRR